MNDLPFNDDQDKRPVGRPSKYKPEYAEQAIKLCKLGATDKDLAEFFDVEEQTINNWKNDFPEFFESIKAAKDYRDQLVERRLFERATGYEVEAEELKVVSEGNGMGSSVERVPVVKKFPPDVTAAIFWLKNRQPDKWRDKTEVDNTHVIKNYTIGFEEEDGAGEDTTKK